MIVDGHHVAYAENKDAKNDDPDHLGMTMTVGGVPISVAEHGVANNDDPDHLGMTMNVGGVPISFSQHGVDNSDPTEELGMTMKVGGQVLRLSHKSPIENQEKLEKVTRFIEKEDDGEITTMNIGGVPISFFEKDSFTHGI